MRIRERALRGFGGWVVALCFALGCGLDGDTATRLDDRVYVLESSDGFTRVPGTTVRISFEDGMFGFSGGCNGHGGTYEIRDGRLIILGLGSTQIGCDAELHAQDDWLATFFTSMPALTIDGDRLTFVGEDGTLVFLDREVADPDRALIGNPWTIDTLIGGGAASNVPVSPQPTVLFTDDGNVEANTSCNTSGGRYVINGNTLTLTEMAYTERGCNAPSIEAHVQAVLTNGTVTFSINANRLSLDRGDMGLRATTP